MRQKASFVLFVTCLLVLVSNIVLQRYSSKMGYAIPQTWYFLGGGGGGGGGAK
jgi:hypothetical protein